MVCATVNAMGVAGLPVLLPTMEFAARFACFASVTVAASIVHVAPDADTVMSPLSPSETPPLAAAHV